MEMILKYKKEIITGIALALLLFLFLKYVFPLISPFILAYLTVYSVYPLLYKLEEKWKIKKAISMFFVLGLLVVIVLAIVWIIVAISGGSVEEIMPKILEWKDKLVLTSGYEIINKLLPEILKNSFSYVQKVFPILAYIGIYLIATILIAKDFDGMMIKVRSIGALDSFMNVVGEILRTAGMFLKSQGILMLLTMTICIAGFYIVGISSPILFGILTGIMDALPFIGTGIVLIPTALLFFLEREIWKGVACLIIYIICVAVREFMEPRLMGKELGMFPVVLLISIYVGIELFGVAGIIKGPLAIVLYKNLWTAINKNKEKEKTA